MQRTVLITEGPLDEKLFRKLKLAASAGIDAIQIRSKESNLYQFALNLRKAVSCKLFINERVDIAIAVHADGVHLPENALSCSYVKKIAPSLVVGKSVHSLKEAKLAEQEGADYIHFGPIFETGAKKEPQGLPRLTVMAQSLSIPTIAVGGITPMRAANCIDAGAYGIAAISAFLNAEDIEATVLAFKRSSKAPKKSFSGLTAIVDCHQIKLAEAAINGGADCIQLRHKEMFTKENFKAAEEIAKLCQKNEVVFIVNDRIDIALALNANGVHLGEGDLPIAAARKALGPKRLIGATAGSVKAALKAQADGADYIGFGHIFPTTSKVKKGSPLGLNTLAELKKQLQIPLIAIGGIDEKNVNSVLKCGVDGIAIISAIASAKDPQEVTKQIRKCFLSR